MWLLFTYKKVLFEKVRVFLNWREQKNGSKDSSRKKDFVLLKTIFLKTAGGKAGRAVILLHHEFIEVVSSSRWVRFFNTKIANLFPVLVTFVQVWKNNQSPWTSLFIGRILFWNSCWQFIAEKQNCFARSPDKKLGFHQKETLFFNMFLRKGREHFFYNCYHSFVKV